jgi:superoxide dismutase, Fe-Mn family
MAFEQAALPFASDALAASGMKAETFEYHYGKHHKAYVDNLNKLVADKPEYTGKTLEEVIKMSAGNDATAGIFNNAAQVWNHAFFWNSIKANGGGAPTGAVADKINAAFGSYEKFREEFTAAATTQFGSGWAWLVEENGSLKITKTGNADNPLTKSLC